MTAEMNAPISTSVFGLPLRIWKPRPTLPPVKLWMIGLMMSAVNAVIRALNARATTSPTATTIMSPRIRKFLKPLMFLLHSHAGGISPRTPVTVTVLPNAIASASGFWTCHTIPVPAWQCKRFRPSGRALTCGSAGPWSAGQRGRVPAGGAAVGRARRRHGRGAEHLHQQLHRGRVGRVAVPYREHVAAGAGQRHGPDSGVPRG